MQFIYITCQVEDYRNVLKIICRPFAITSHKAFLKNKIRSGTRTSFCTWFFGRKIFIFLYSINWPNFIIWFPLLLETLCYMCTVRPFHQKMEKKLFRDCNLPRIILYISVTTSWKTWMETMKYWKSLWYPFCTPLKFNKSHSIFL